MWYTITMPIRNPLDPNDPTDPRHGTLNGYTNHKCRCVPCLDFGRNYFKEQARERRKKGLPARSKLHGTEGGYSNYGCRCVPCCEARAEAAADWRQKVRRRKVRETVSGLEAEGTGIHRINAAKEAGLI